MEPKIENGRIKSFFVFCYKSTCEPENLSRTQIKKDQLYHDKAKEDASRRGIHPLFCNKNKRMKALRLSSPINM